ncbi:hypothetical protein PFHG_05344 [Plasmodium falciparum HB3]|uniref:Duffy-antigen binding domain-containing protein n=1 Tax=Plasmodium falciparum (isolate HB3) TaxID=137071 RepID=A0A0L7KJT5_PLAFX|nr:hypothetical protein PFHG_05344 [Plasmodium falciparum HB3]
MTQDMKCNGIQIEDYIPQRLRWMTEWAEWFCKMQSQEFENLVPNCAGCMNKNNNGGKGCTQGDNDCTTCDKQCKEYGEKIKKWKDQWTKMDEIYQFLYLQARTVRDRTAFDNPTDQQVVEFFKELQKEIKNSDSKRPKRSAPGVTALTPNTDVYSSAAGYIHQELPNVGCNTQTEFCKNGKGEKYTFENPPPLYKEACNCENNTKPQPAPKKEEEACNMVNTILSAHAGKNEIDSCNEKNDRTWNCSDDTFNEHNKGACMPPRRQSLCIHDLKELTKNSSKEQLREAFIKCAAIETHFLWIYYKNKNSSIVDTQLQNGNIPDEFKRIMYYTFGDYRDICLGTDISSDSNIKGISQKVNDILNSQYGKTHEQNITPKTWWEKNKNDIWQGILCALPHSDQLKNKPEYKTPPEEFAQTPQFLRWFTEWGDQFCRERGVKIKELKEGCKDYECKKRDDDKKKACVKACKEYQTWLQGWKDQYKQQSAKFDRDKKDRKFENTSAQEDVDVSSANEYLNEQLKKLCEDEKFSCMENFSQQVEETELSGQNILPEDLDYPPKEIGEKCKCAIPPEPMSCVEKTAQKLRKIAEKNVEPQLKVNGKKYNDNCNVTKEKYQETKGGNM